LVDLLSDLSPTEGTELLSVLSELLTKYTKVRVTLMPLPDPVIELVPLDFLGDRVEGQAPQIIRFAWKKVQRKK
jgi:hypothetical protein